MGQIAFLHVNRSQFAKNHDETHGESEFGTLAASRRLDILNQVGELAYTFGF